MLVLVFFTIAHDNLSLQLMKIVLQNEADLRETTL